MPLSPPSSRACIVSDVKWHMLLLHLSKRANVPMAIRLEEQHNMYVQTTDGRPRGVRLLIAGPLPLAFPRLRRRCLPVSEHVIVPPCPRSPCPPPLPPVRLSCMAGAASCYVYALRMAASLRDMQGNTDTPTFAVYCTTRPSGHLRFT